MLAAVDISNTRVAIGVFEGERLRAAFALATDVRKTPEEYRLLLRALLDESAIHPSDVEGAAIASVVPPLTEAFEQVCSALFRTRPLTVGAGIRTGIRVGAHNPREVGADRIVNAVAAKHLHGCPAVVVDLGTATSFDVAGRDGSYLGSVIAPGLGVAAEALFQHASRLHRVELARPRSVIGRDTASAVQSGLVFGHVAMVEGMLSRIQAELGQRAVVVATGEFAPIVVRETAAVDRVEPYLSLIGLRLLYELNQEDG